jgi:hypothetical protein
MSRTWLAPIGVVLAASLLLACPGAGADATTTGIDGGASATPDGAAPADDAGSPSPDGGASDGANASDAPAGDASDAGPVYTKLPCTLTVGTGSGTLDVSAATGKPGDVVCVAAGTYTGGSIKGLTSRTLQNDGGLVTITGVVEIGNLTGVTFSGSGVTGLAYGFQLAGPQASFVITGPNSGLVVHDFEAVGAGIFLDAGHTGLVWSGDPSGFVLYKTLLDRIHLKQSGQLFQGNYGALSAFTNFASDVEMSNIVVEDSKGTGQNVVSGGGMFNLNVHDWTITSPNDVVVGSGDDRDTGVLMVFGSGVFKRLHRDGGWGWLVRTFGVQLGPQPGEFHCEDNVDLSTEYYGTCEIRNDDTPSYLIPGKLSTVGIFIANNVSAHKKDIKGSYTTAIGLIPNLIAGTTATLTNNVGCDDVNDYGDKDSLHFFQVNGTVSQSGNQALASCAGRVDPITGKPL